MHRCMGCMAQYPDTEQVCPHCGYLRGTPPREAYHLEPESILNGRYIVGKVLGFGGFGVTYIGYDAALERVVAIKEFLPTTFATRYPGSTLVTVYEGNATGQFTFGLTRFLEEAERLAQFSTIPGITDIYDTFRQNNTAYIVMEFLKGVDVKHLLSQQGPLPYEQAREIILSVCDTLTPVHAQNIIHRDLSPDNIYLLDDGKIKLLDFGAARHESGVNPKSLSVILKAGYAPEEQYRSRGVQGPWTDVYALAATLYKLLTGQTPPDSMERAVRDEIKEPSKLGVSIPESAENALMNALNIRQQERTQSVEAFAAALRSDGVERIKPKKPISRAGRGMIVGAVALVVMGALMAAILLTAPEGASPLGAPAVLEDNFGSALEEGMGAVPSLLGKTKAEAEALLQTAGLTLQALKGEVSTRYPQGQALWQSVEAGKQLDRGSAVEVIFSLGDFGTAVEAGTLPSPVGMEATASAGFLANILVQDTQWAPYNPYFFTHHYEYSDTVPQGLVTRYTYEKGSTHIKIFVSAGPEDGKGPFGQPRAPFLSAQGEMLLALPGCVMGEENDYGGNYLLQVSKDGSSWHSPLLSIQSPTTDTYSGGSTIPYLRYDLQRSLSQLDAQFGSGTLQLALARTQEIPEITQPVEAVLERFPFPHTVSLTYTQQAVTATGAEIVSWDAVGKAIESRELSSNTELGRIYRGEMGDKTYTLPLKLTGSFLQDQTYQLVSPTGPTYGTSSDGSTLYLPLKSYFLLPKQAELFVYGSVKVALRADGGQLDATMETPYKFNLQIPQSITE